MKNPLYNQTPLAKRLGKGVDATLYPLPFKKGGKITDPLKKKDAENQALAAKWGTTKVPRAFSIIEKTNAQTAREDFDRNTGEINVLRDISSKQIARPVTEDNADWTKVKNIMVTRDNENYLDSLAQRPYDNSFKFKSQSPRFADNEIGLIIQRFEDRDNPNKGYYMPTYNKAILKRGDVNLDNDLLALNAHRTRGNNPNDVQTSKELHTWKADVKKMDEYLQRKNRIAPIVSR